MSVARVRDAYAARAGEYIAVVGSIEHAADQDREYVLAWARGVGGHIIDVGCGPGQWTNYLRERGVDVEGVDPVPEFIDDARRRYPDAAYRIGHADRLDVEDASLGGVLSWYSLIHTDPDEIDALLTEFARAIRPGGGLAVGFFEGPEPAPFDHAVTTAYFWPVDLLSSRIEQAGFVVSDTQTRTDPGRRRHGAITALRRH
ncbi:class I SAM-dependent methyltransferase [Phytoactinopolyspora mesophila]|uniref:Methyltransferase domain-containing protein n=1 Tax=Phytoactinopolyspora mesophila TaxID=2650750 RepID=A0A7K3M977_9ACTN|nr:class I SAM-dependent methyltransferase [Phytoactinopolyspora mesophila]NDL59502.1 methyltransferase domain-containing protein [Phytoactinopolyspora mesophila]